MPISKPKNIALLAALAVTLLFSLVYVTLVLFYFQFRVIPLLVSLPVIFVFSYLIIKFSLTKFIYEKIKLIYKTIGEFNEKEQSRSKKSESLEKVNRVVYEWSEKQKRQIEELKKMAAYRREFLGNVSHELKTPIFNIQGYILTLLDGGLEDPNINKSFLMKTEKSINRLIAIVEDLEEISKLESGALKLIETPFDLYSLCTETIDYMELKARKNNSRIDLNPPTTKLFRVIADKKRVRQILINLIDNAIKYGNKNDNRIAISIHDFGEKYLIEISDNGQGISEKNLPRVFERFYRTDKGRSRDKGGTGLGLAIVKHIIEAHRQTITVRSKKGEGTSFSFTLKKD